MKTLNYLIVAAVIVCLFTPQLAKAQWPQWRGPMRDGFSPETNLLKIWPAEGPRLMWSTDTIGNGFSSAVVSNKVIFTTGIRDSIEIISAINLTGELIWQQKIGKAGENWSTPTIYKNKLYAITTPGEIYCVDIETGKLNWKINIPKIYKGASCGDKFCESPLVSGDKVVITPCGKNTTMVALNSATGETIWTSESLADSAFFVSPVLIQDRNKKLVVTSIKNHILAVDLSTGKIVSKEKTSSTYFYIPLPGNREVYFSNEKGDGKMISINNDLNNFNIRWNDLIKVFPMGGTVGLDKRIYGTLNQGKGLFCVDWETGKILSINKGVSASSLLAADGMIYGYEYQRGRVFLMKPNGDNTDLVSSFMVKSGSGPHLAHLSIANGTLFIRHGKCLMAYDVKQYPSSTKRVYEIDN